MARPNYTQEELQELTERYQEDAIRYANQIIGQLQELEDDPNVDRNSDEYKARKTVLNSVLYQTLDFERNAYFRISAGYPARFSSRSMERLSNRLLEDPVYANVMLTAQYEYLDNDLQQENMWEDFRESVAGRLPDSMGPTALAEDVMPRQTRSGRAIVLRQVLQELEATGTGYYVPGWRRGSNSPEFENVKRELRRQIGMLEGGLPLSSNDDDRLIGLMNTYSRDKRSTRTRGFGNTRQRSMQKLYAELTRHPSPRGQGAPAYPTPEEAAAQYNIPRRLNDPRYAGHEDYVDLTRPEYEVHPERTVAQEYNDTVAQIRQMTNTRRTTNRPLTDEERAVFLDQTLRAAALQTIILRDPAGPNAAVNPVEVEKLMDAGMSNEALGGAVTAAFHSWDHMQELTSALEAYRPQLQQNGQYLADPGNYRNPLFRRLRVIAQPTIAERLLDAKNELRDLEFDGGPITMGQRNRLRVLAQHVLALQQLADAADNGGLGIHLSDQEANVVLSQITDTTDVQRAVDTCLNDPEKAQEYVETLTAVGSTFQDMKSASSRMARGGVRDMIDHEEAVLTEMPEYEFNHLEQAAAEERIIRFAALNRLRDAHRNDPNPNVYVSEEEIAQAMDEVRADGRFMASIQGKLTSVDAFHRAAAGMCSLRYARHYARALEYQQRIQEDPEAADMFEGYLMNEIASMAAIRAIQQQAGTEHVFISNAQMEAAVQAQQLGDAYLALQRGVERDGIGIAEALLTNTFNKSGDEYQQAFGQNVVPMIRRYPYPPFQAGTIGAADAEISPRLTTDSNTTLAATGEGRRELVDLMIRRLALRRMAMEDPEGGYARMTQQKRQQLARYEAEIRLDPNFMRHFRAVIDSPVTALQTINQMNGAVSLPNLKARYNRAQGGDFVDPLAAGFTKLTPEEWIQREMEKLEDAATQPGKHWTAPERESLIRSYARVHLMQVQLARSPERAADTVTQRQIDDMLPEFLSRPGMRQKLDSVFAQPARALNHTIDAVKRQTMANAQLSDADKLARLMAVGKLERELFGNAILTPAEIAAAEQEVRQSAAYQRLAAHLNAGNGLDTIAPAEGENYYNAMQDKAFQLPGTQQTYDARNRLLAEELRSLKQQGRLDEAGNVAAQIYILAQYEQDGVPYGDLPNQAELVRMADSLNRTADFKDALAAMKAAPDSFDQLANGAEGVDVKMRADDMTFRLNSYALRARLTNDPDDQREPNLLHELRAGVMQDAVAKLIQGNATEAWVSDEEKNARRDEYIRFTALNRLMTQRPGTAYLPEADVQAEIAKLRQDEVFMQRLESRLDSPTLLRNSVFNSAGVVRWSDTDRMDGFHDMLKAASQAEKEGREGFGHVYGAVSEYLAGTIDTRLSGREEDNVSLATRDLNASVNSVLYSDRFRVLENAIRRNPGEFDRVANLFKLPAADFREQYEKLTDEFAQRYPDAPSKDTGSVSASYEKALAGIKAAGQEGAEAIAADEAKRQALAQNIREVFLDRRVLLKAKKDPQLMRRDLSGDSVKTSSKVEAMEAQESEAVDRMLGDLNEKLKDPQAVQGYLELMNGAEDLRILAAADFHAREPFKDPLLVRLEEKGLAVPAIDRQARQAALISQSFAAAADETAQQREARLQDQIAQLIVDKMYEGIPDDELPNAAAMEARRNMVKSDPYFQTAVARLAANPGELRIFLQSIPDQSLREIGTAMDHLYKNQMLATDPQSEPACNMFYLWSAQAIRSYEERVDLSTTGQDLNDWAKGRKEVALDSFVRFTAYHRLLQENPQRVEFSQAEVEAKIKEVDGDERFMRAVESQQKNAAEMRKFMFGYPGVVLYKMRSNPESYVAPSLRNPGYCSALMPGCLESMAESLLFRLKRPDCVLKNYCILPAENKALIDEFKKTDEYKMLHRAFLEHPRWANRFLFEVIAAKPDEVQDCYDSFLADVREAYGIEAPQEEKAAEEEDLEFVMDGQVVDVKDGVKAVEEILEQEERELNGENDLEADALRDVDLDENIIFDGEAPEAVGWASIDRNIEDLVFTGDPSSYFNQQRAAMHSILKAPSVYPQTLTACLENMYVAAILKKAGKEITEEAVDENRHLLRNDALFQKFRSKCLADHKFAEAQLKNFTEADFAKMYRAQSELSPDAFERLKEQIRWDLNHGNMEADFEKNFRKLYAMTKFGPQERPKAAEIEQKAETLKNDPALNKALSRLKGQGQNGQPKLNSGYGLMLLDGVFAYNKEATVNTRLGGITGPTFKQSTELKYHNQYDAKPVRILAPGTDVAPGSPAAEFRNNAAKLDETMQARQRTAAAGGNAAMSDEEVKTLAAQTCKTVALYNLSQSPKYQGKPVEKDALRAEMLRLKDDPEMKAAIRAAAEDPQAHKALVEGMMRTHEDPAAFTAYVRGFGDDWKSAKGWLDSVYTEPIQRFASRTYKPEPRFAGIPQLFGVTVRSDAFTKEDAADGSQLSDKFTQLKEDAAAEWNSFIIRKADERKALGPQLQKKMAKVYALKQIRAAQEDPKAEVKDLDEKIERRAEKLLADPAFKTAMTSLVKAQNKKVSEEIAAPILAEKSYTPSADQLQNVIDKRYCIARDLDPLTGKKLPEEHEIQAEGPGLAPHN